MQGLRHHLDCNKLGGRGLPFLFSERGRVSAASRADAQASPGTFEGPRVDKHLINAKYLGMVLLLSAYPSKAATRRAQSLR